MLVVGRQPVSHSAMMFLQKNNVAVMEWCDRAGLKVFKQQIKKFVTLKKSAISNKIMFY